MSAVPQNPGPSDARCAFSCLRQAVLYPDRYTWYVFASAMDIITTVTLLVHLGAREVNTIAQRSIDLFGTWGLVGLKTITMVIVIVICEFVGRRNRRAGAFLATAAVFASLLPVLAGWAQVAILAARGALQYIPYETSEIHP